MVENADQQLSELGTVPDDLQAIVARTLGDRPITPAVADELLEALAAGKKFDLPPAPTRAAEPEPEFASVASPAT
ncbi:MAG TPA: hypothetical protein VJV78_01425, partial [Polyangiales bacterium]|nr:hypothetical protein [Polyangiales bacterium]